ncbi:GAF and ANTAR domain-containing protein [Rathayibacter sp. VKM Ac-2760]|uniref:GAF and ANTAR domain-containing protein n=1 Tax=Rathayibacter sp. VKM Ac-2760 TaxID=2609253 RepID=UPI0013181430|nr:GAF and ANTAR domain-containing protein [Rathayibacter sp. VKM Ac-2760]QHC60367.1 GAF domain-containing protein [Rathayibacter sp. VKM Ac-2760]
MITEAGSAGGPLGPQGELLSLLSSFVTLLPVEDTAVSALGAPFEIETLAATSSRSARLDEAQIDLGEGPAWDAYRNRRPVAMLIDRDRASWPFFCASPAAIGVHSVVAVPLAFGPLPIGAVSLYSGALLALDADQLALAESLAALLGRAVVARVVAEAESGAPVRDPALSRREVHQATGMVISQTGSSPEDALLAIRAHAFRTGTTVRAVAAEIVARRLDFSPDSDDPKAG